jgi:hypothetical protein
MSIERTAKTILHCDMDACLTSLTIHGSISKLLIERWAKLEDGWRKDKLGRNICPSHPKVKGAGHGSS